MPPRNETEPKPDGDAALTLEQVSTQADAAMAQALAIAQEAGELFADISNRLAALEATAGGAADRTLAERVARLEQHVTLPRERETPSSPDLCSDCGAPMSGQHFDDCAFLENPQPKGPRNLQRREQAAVR